MKAITIAVRYSASRKQFGPDDGTNVEYPVLEYQSQVIVQFNFSINNSFKYFENISMPAISFVAPFGNGLHTKSIFNVVGI